MPLDLWKSPAWKMFRGQRWPHHILLNSYYVTRVVKRLMNLTQDEKSGWVGTGKFQMTIKPGTVSNLWEKDSVCYMTSDIADCNNNCRWRVQRQSRTQTFKLTETDVHFKCYSPSPHVWSSRPSQGRRASREQFPQRCRGHTSRRADRQLSVGH